MQLWGVFGGGISHDALRRVLASLGFRDARILPLDEKGYQEYGDNGEDDDDNDDDDDDDDDEENAHRLRSALMQGGRASLWRLVPPTDMKAEEVDAATPKMLTRISKWQKGWS